MIVSLRWGCVVQCSSSECFQRFSTVETCVGCFRGISIQTVLYVISFILKCKLTTRERLDDSVE